MKQEMNAALKDLDEALREAELALVEMDFGVPGWVRLFEPDDDDRTSRSSTALHFEEGSGGRWGLFVRDEEGDPFPILSASREEKVRAAAVISNLAEVLRQRSTDEITPIRNAARAARAFASKTKAPAVSHPRFLKDEKIEECRGGCSRGGDGPACGKRGCRG